VGWTELVAGIIGSLVGAALRPYVERHVPAPGRMASVRRDVERAWTDHGTWLDREERAMHEELEKVDEDLVARGISNSGVRVAANAKVRRKYLDELEKNQRLTVRATEDAFARLGVVE